MIGQTLSHYDILEKLGSGGMGVVYKAEDRKLKRIVALKFLPAELTRDEAARERFVHEAQAASALDHPNICTIYEIDETDAGEMFIAMAYYEGETLDKKIERGPLKLEEAIEITTQLTQGLAKAHARGIFHRDIKPANIMITQDGTVKILDFGLAKLTGRTQLTQTGTTMGTVVYASPEQTRGDPTDRRTDIWAVGVILYEMLTGRAPFVGDYEQAVVYSILNENPEPVTALRSGIPMELEHLIGKAMEKDPDERFQHADDLLADLRRLKKTSPTRAERYGSARVQSRRRRLSASPVLWTLFIVLFGLAGGVLLFYPSETIPFSERDWILITDFDNLTGDELFDKSLNAALAVSIQQSNYVNLFPRPRAQETLKRMRIERVDTLGQELAREIAVRENIKALVVPSISRVGGVYALTATIVEPNSQEVLKTASSQGRGKDDVLNALDELARQIRKDLGESLASISEQSMPLPKVTTSSLEALKSFVEGRKLRDRDNEAGLRLIQEAIKLDPDFALAHADLGVHYYIINQRPKGEEHFQKALSRLDRLTLRERLWIQAVAEDWRGNREQAIENYRTYVAQYPDDGGGWFDLGYAYLITRRFDRAIEAFNRVIEIHPSEAFAYVNIATCYNALRKDDPALEHYSKAFELRPELLTGIFVNNEYGFLLARKGEIQKAEETFEKMLSSEEPGKKAKGHRSIALLNMYLGKYSVAADHLKEAILISKTSDAELSELRDHLYLASVFRATGKPDAFRAELKAAEAIHEQTPLAPYWLSLLGKLYVRAGMLEEAAQLLPEVSAQIEDLVAQSGVGRSNRGDQAAHHLLIGEVQLAKGKHAEALEDLEIAHRLQEGSYSLESLAHGYLVSGDLSKAVLEYEELIAKKDLGWEAQEYWILAHYRLGRIYEEKGEKETAIDSYERFLEIWKDADEDLVELVDARKRLARLRR